MKILKHWRAKVEVEISKSNPNTSIDKEGLYKVLEGNNQYLDKKNRAEGLA
jgi:hypothetical protein